MCLQSFRKLCKKSSGVSHIPQTLLSVFDSMNIDTLKGASNAAFVHLAPFIYQLVGRCLGDADSSFFPALVSSSFYSANDLS